MKPPINWPSGVTSAVCITFDLDAETAWISRDATNINRALGDPAVVARPPCRALSP
jgi:hypothetical protein